MPMHSTLLARTVLTFTAGLLLLTAPVVARAAEEEAASDAEHAQEHISPLLTVEMVTVKASTLCLSTAARGTSIKDKVQQFGFPELPKDEAEKFDESGGPVFALPPHEKELVMITAPGQTCKVAARKVNFKTFWQEVDKLYGSDDHFTLIAPKNMPEEGSASRLYESLILNKKVHTLITAWEAGPKDGVQATITTELAK